MKDDTPPADHGEAACHDVWANILARAQADRTSTICGRVYRRIRFGGDLFGRASSLPTCRDCGAARGELHVPTCCWEQCPRCGGQAISCDCESVD
jgi:hypothetical protein